MLSPRFLPRLSQLTTTSSLRSLHTLPDLPYAYHDLEPAIDREIMRLHHSIHHATFVNNLNLLEIRLAEAVARQDVSTVIAMQRDVKFNGGGHLNHSLFWENLTPGGCRPSVALEAAVCRQFGSMGALEQELVTRGLGVGGSGWCWLGWSKEKGRLEVEVCGEQDPLEATTGLVPLLGLDVWEHAYYLQYRYSTVLPALEVLYYVQCTCTQECVCMCIPSPWGECIFHIIPFLTMIY